MILQKIQNLLIQMYQLPLQYPVGPYLLATPTGKIIGNPLGKEALVIRETTGSVEVGLYMDPATVQNLEEHNPFEKLDENNFSDFCAAIEGVSHLLYFLFRAEKGETVTELELELQADVDRFLLLCLLVHKSHEMVPQEMLRRLFDDIQLRKGLTRKMKERYLRANNWAAKFCSKLERNFLKNGNWRATLAEARLFYQRNHWQKIRYLTP